MIVSLDKDYQVQVEKFNNYTLSRRTDSKGNIIKSVGKDGKERELPTVLGHFPTMESAIKSYVRQYVVDRNENERITMEQYLKELTSKSVSFRESLLDNSLRSKL
ncbi:hypothetical protein LpeD_151 [Lactobacillus phage LpeD]|uniref:Uncharacterized protein n=1 Tax=Lactobacillus phage LpeD TaxID=2041210 RepID=A0A291I9N6_9CAUD|nr:replication initiation protein [Lactobacillus phage LpeD]ATG86395.1 hypothetical protein LpeD_151 [Lactobacillus phage LpeD]